MSIFKRNILLALSFSGYALAAQASNYGPAQWDIMLGAGFTADSRVWTNADNETDFFPLFEASLGNWHFGFESFVAYQIEADNLPTFYVGIGTRDDAAESDVFKDYDTPKTETVINYGASYGWLALDASTDISTHSEANTFSITAEFPLYQNTTNFSVSALVTTHWMDDNYVNYYYGISSNQVNNSVGRSSYKTDSAVNYETSLKATYLLNKQWMLLGLLSHTILADEIIASPLVDSEYQNSLALLAIYQF